MSQGGPTTPMEPDLEVPIDEELTEDPMHFPPDPADREDLDRDDS